jgi:hypothetical protein
MSKLNEKKKNRSGIDMHKVKQVQNAQEKQHLLKAAKQQQLMEKKKPKKQSVTAEEINVLDRFKSKKKIKK